jgi:hypothetical protein
MPSRRFSPPWSEKRGRPQSDGSLCAWRTNQLVVWMDLVSFHDFIRSVLVADALVSAVIGALEDRIRDDDRRLQALEFASATGQYAVVGCRTLTAAGTKSHFSKIRSPSLSV